MLESFVARNHYSGSFFRLLRGAPQYSCSLALNLLNWFSFFALFDLAKGLNAPNPFTFIQNDTLYSLRTTPEVSASEDYRGWSAYQSIVDEVMRENLGPITQSPGSYYFPIEEWSAKACDLDIVLESNGTEQDSFMFDFINLVYNNTEFTSAASMSPDQCKHPSQSDIIILTMLCVLGAVLVLAIVKFACDELFKCTRRSGYDRINDDRRNRQQRLAVVEDEEAQPLAGGRLRATSV